ncbi:hypothetical protein ACKFKF_11005 [Phormidesmis sp. 146-12]
MRSSRDGQVQSSFEPERYGHFMERCAIAADNSKVSACEKINAQQRELG